jgi:hypothetical protein
VGQVEEDLDSFAYDFVTFVAADIGDKSDAAGVMLLRGVVETLSWRQTVRIFQTRRHHIIWGKASFAAWRGSQPPGRFRISCS